MVTKFGKLAYMVGARLARNFLASDANFGLSLGGSMCPAFVASAVASLLGGSSAKLVNI